MAAREITESIERIQTGDFLRVIWWFHKFDDQRYRRHLMCNPPYENAPRCGVFATRSPVRPNPLASTIVKVKSTDPYNQCISVLGFDGFEHSVILQVMPYQEKAFSEIKVPEWVGHWTNYKVFPDIPEINNISDKTKKLTCDNEVDYCEELESEEYFEHEYMGSNEIIVENVSIHNLKDITVRIPKEKITVITGVSGSGKSSLAFDTIYHESQKQFMDLIASNSLLGTDLKDSMVKRIAGLQPSIAIEQKNLGTNPRSTVASVTRIGEYLRLLFSTIGERVCPNCKAIVAENNVCNNCGTIFFTLTPALFNYNHPEYMCPVCKGFGEELQVDIDLIVTNSELSILDGASVWWGNLRKHREKPNANWMKGAVLALAADMNEDLEVPFKDLSESFKQQIFYGSNRRKVTLRYENTNGRNGTISRPVEGVVNILQRLLVDNNAPKSMDHIERFVVNKKCSRCKGERLLEEGRLVRISNTRYPEATMMNITELKKWCHSTYSNLDKIKREKCRVILTKIISRLKKLEQVGLGYINLDRSIPSLSGGEAQRLKIATQLGLGLSNILYIMDEPSKGLHPKDFQFLIETIKDLKKQKNTIIIVEHKKEFIQMADYLVEIGPGAGHYGGRLLRAESVENNKPWVFNNFDYVIKCDAVEVDEKLILKGVRTNNLKNVDVSLPLTKFIGVIGVSGSGKSSLISKTLYPAMMKELGKSAEAIGQYDSLIGVNHISGIYYVSQRAIGKNSRSTPGTYTGVFDLIRDYYAKISDAKQAKLTKEHFSFNSAKGQCDECKGAGEIAIPMHFMPDIYITCNKCNGKRYQEPVLKIEYKGHSIADLLDMEIGEVKEIFKNESSIYRILDMLCKVGLSYIKLGQSAATLSGGEAQRIKLAKELCDGKAKDTIYILDEPTTGLHDDDVDKLCYIIRELTSKGATVVVIEHNPRIISQADYIIEMGPKGGDLGGYVVREGWLMT
ncbi:TrmO family methyltransferase domain-containing protein [Desulfosporosinus nitroreducens]|uniref:TrmO family methyltransferase domain-containing protein n=1 Tax=Desulfosporosinus nitroreducens TaxID=2018668 RepID=UPI0028525193|nr:TrmO family methyltransferase [Desulfosporosinus nitroreducens]